MFWKEKSKETMGRWVGISGATKEKEQK